VKGPLLGLYRATFMHDVDPASRLRLRVLSPSRGDASASGIWAEAYLRIPTGDRPAYGAGVWVIFEAGDPDPPVRIATMRP
jgi:hypothetical protein